MHRLLLGAALAALLALPVAASAATKPVPVTLSGTFFNDKPNAKLTVKLGASLRFVWKDGFHNVAHPEGAGRGQEGQQRRSRRRSQADPLQARQEGQVRLLLHAAQGARHGADRDGELERRRAHQVLPAVGRDEQLAVGGDRPPDAVVAGIGGDDRRARARCGARSMP